MTALSRADTSHREITPSSDDLRAGLDPLAEYLGAPAVTGTGGHVDTARFPVIAEEIDAVPLTTSRAAGGKFQRRIGHKQNSATLRKFDFSRRLHTRKHVPRGILKPGT